jgi:hypothetical protein
MSRNEKPVSLHPLKPEEAIAGLLKVEPPEKPKKAEKATERPKSAKRPKS